MDDENIQENNEITDPLSQGDKGGAAQAFDVEW